MKNVCFVIVLFLAFIGCVYASTGDMLIKADPGAKIEYSTPTWSPKGNSIAYVAMPSCGEIAFGEKGKNIWLATLKGGKWNHKLLLKDADYPVWSPDGKKLAIARDGLSILTLATGKISRLTKDYIPSSDAEDEVKITIDQPISFSPNGKYLAYHRSLWEVDETRIFDMVLGKDTGLRVGRYPEWSSDSKYMLSAFNWFMDCPVPTRLIRTDIKSRKSNTVLSNYRIEGITWPGASKYAWVLLGKLLPENSGTDLKPPYGVGIYKLDTKTGSLTKIVSVRMESLYWSPDNKQFAFLSKLAMNASDVPKINLYVGNMQNWYFKSVAKDAATPSYNWNEQVRHASWSQDCHSIAYVTQSGDIRILKL